MVEIIYKYYREEEHKAALNLASYLAEDYIKLQSLVTNSLDLAAFIRNNKKTGFQLDNLVNAYPISGTPGKNIMFLTESLLRTPDYTNQNNLIIEKIKTTPSWLISTKYGFLEWLLAIFLQFGKYILPKKATSDNKVAKLVLKVANKFSKIVMRRIAKQFVFAENIHLALKSTNAAIAAGYSLSFDILGEAARDEKDALLYFNEYKEAITKAGEYSQKLKDSSALSISVKLSSLHPRYELAAFQNSKTILFNRMLELCRLAKKYNLILFIDAEETERLALSLELLQDLLAAKELEGWQGLGFVVQAYQKCIFYALDDIAKIVKKHNKKLYLRLVKGAYWDSEIKLDQINGVKDFALFTRKEHTDISYFACAKKMAISYSDVFFPCFATHNAITVAYIKDLMGVRADFEFQCLHGMGDELYSGLLKKYKVRKYAPIGKFEQLLPYLIRRLLENGASNSFVNQIINKEVQLQDIIKNPLDLAKEHNFSSNPLIKLPKNMFMAEPRINSQGIDMIDKTVLTALQQEVIKNTTSYQAFPIINGKDVTTKEEVAIINPADLKDVIGKYHNSDKFILNQAIAAAASYYPAWQNTNAIKRAEILNNIANKVEEKTYFLASLIVREAGKTLKDAVLDIREGVDFLRYYAEKAKELFANNFTLPGPIGEQNTIKLEGRGVFLCISPWNFPFAIFMGQIAGALAAGNTVLAKPAEATSLVGYIAIKLMLEAGLPSGALQFTPGQGAFVGEELLEHPLLAGVAFTGSEKTAHTINKKLANRSGAILPLIAETGGQNVMVVDSTALLDRVVPDIISSAFQSAGQRCSALRVLYVQNEIADSLVEMLKGAMEELNIANPKYVASDIGPVINQAALDKLNQHSTFLEQNAKHIYTAKLAENLNGYYFAPRVFEIPSITLLKAEVFGPILHIIRYNINNLEDVVADVNSTGYGLTFAIQSNLQERIDYFSTNINCGNIYVNRNQIGAVVGSQPFGGRGKSGTGPKAGGPFYLHRFATEKTVSVNTTAQGGNADLMSKL